VPSQIGKERGGKITQLGLRRRLEDGRRVGRRGRGVAPQGSPVPGEDGRASRPRPSFLINQRMPLTILYVEDNKFVAQAVRDLLEGEGWRVELYADGNSALNRLAGGVRYDLLLLDNDLPGASGMELARYACSLPAHRGTPIIMLSADGLESEARVAGADLFLRKPDDIHALVEAVRQLIE
jgi:CheY-like chemotaxis protein